MAVTPFDKRFNAAIYEAISGAMLDPTTGLSEATEEVDAIITAGRRITDVAEIRNSVATLIELQERYPKAFALALGMVQGAM